MSANDTGEGRSLVQAWNDPAPAGGEVVVSGTAVVTESVTLGIGPGGARSLRVEPGGLVRPARGVTLTIDAPIGAGRWRIFDLELGGSVVLGPAAGAEVRPEWFGAVGDGRGDDLPALRAMSRALTRGALVRMSGTYRIVYDRPAPSPPPPGSAIPVWDGNNATYGILITQPDVWVVGEGSAGIFMDGYTYDTALQYVDCAGVDRYTAIAFNGTSGGGVRDLRFTGNGDGTPLVVPGGPPPGQQCWPFLSRAKGVGITNSSNVTVSGVTGSGIVGNVVNARGDNTTGSRGITVTGCRAERCSENGFNFMGGTYDCTFNDNTSIGNGFSGFESGTTRITCNNNTCRQNQMHGINHVGASGTFTNNTLADNVQVGFVFQAQGAPLLGQNNLVSANVITGNVVAGISADPATYGNRITDNQLLDNGAPTVAQGIMLGQPGATGPAGYMISGNRIQETRSGLLGAVGLMVYGATNLMVTGNTFQMTMQYSVTASGGANQTYVSNVANQPFNVSTAVANVVSHDNTIT